MEVYNNLVFFLAYVIMCGRYYYYRRYEIYNNIKSCGSNLTKVGYWTSRFRTQQYGLTKTFSVIYNFICFLFSPHEQLNMLFNYSLNTLRYVFVILAYIRVSLYFYTIYNVLYSTNINLVGYTILLTILELYVKISNNKTLEKYIIYSDLFKFVIAYNLDENKVALISLIQFVLNLYNDTIKKYVVNILIEKIVSSVKSEVFKQCKYTFNNLQFFLINELSRPKSISRTISYFTNDTFRNKINEIIVKIKQITVSDGESNLNSNKKIMNWISLKMTECINYSETLINVINTEIQYWGLCIVYTIFLVLSYTVWIYTNNVSIFTIDVSLRLFLACLLIIKFNKFTEPLANTFVYFLDDYCRYMKFGIFLLEYSCEYIDNKKEIRATDLLRFGSEIYITGHKLRFW